MALVEARTAPIVDSALVLAALLDDVTAFAERGAGFWRITELALPALNSLSAVAAAARTGGRNARFDAIETALENAANAFESPWREAALDHLGFSTRARHIRSLTAREDLAAKQLTFDGRTYRRRTADLRDGRFESWRMKTLTRVAEEVMRTADVGPAELPTDPPYSSSSPIDGLVRAGIAAVYETQAEAEEELLRLLASSARIDILAIRGLGIVGLNAALFRRPLLTSPAAKTIRALFLTPDSVHAKQRAEETGESAASFAQGIALGLARLRELKRHSPHEIDIRLYDELPVWRIIGFEDVAFVSTYVPGREGQLSHMFKIVPQEGGVLYAAFTRMFERMFDAGARDLEESETSSGASQ